MKLLIALLLPFVLMACDDGPRDGEGENGENHNGPYNGPGNHSSQPNTGPGGPNNEGPHDDREFNDLAIKATADLRGAFGLLILEDEQGAALALAEKHNQRVDALGLTGAPKFDIDRQFSLAGESYRISIRQREFYLSQHAAWI